MNATIRDIDRLVARLITIRNAVPHECAPVDGEAMLANHLDAMKAIDQVADAVADGFCQMAHSALSHLPDVDDRALPSRALFTDTIQDMLSDALYAAEPAAEALEPVEPQPSSFGARDYGVGRHGPYGAR